MPDELRELLATPADVRTDAQKSRLEKIVRSTDAELAKAPDTQHIPMVLGSVVITYNLDGVTQPLKFDGDTLTPHDKNTFIIYSTILF